MLLAISLAFATESTDTAEVAIPEGVTVPAVILDCAPVDDSERPLLVVNRKGAFAQKYASLHAGNVFNTIPGYANGSLGGFPMADATVFIDGTRVDFGGRLYR